MDLISLQKNAEAAVPRMLEWLHRMVEVNSFTTNITGVNKVGQITAECFAELGFEPEFVPAANPQHGSHLFLRRGPVDHPPVVLVTHLDTVFPPEEELANNFHWQPDGNRIYGPGTVDIKGGTVLIWLMFKVMREALPGLFENAQWLIAANSAEEVVGSDFACRTSERSPHGVRAVLVFEGGPRSAAGWHLVTARKGRAEFRLNCRGRAAHAGSSHATGINAVIELARILPSIHELTDFQKSLTVNVASVHGGTVLNRVPHEAMMDLEMRAFDPAVLTMAEQELRLFGGKTRAGAEIEVDCLGRTQAWPGGKETETLFHAWEIAADQLGFSVFAEQRGGLSDANYLCSLGPTLDGLGPVGGNAHCSERSSDSNKLPEYVEADSFVPKAMLNILALKQLLRA